MYLPKENKKDKPGMSRDVSWTVNTGDGDRHRLCTSARWAGAGRGRDRHGNHRSVCRQSAQFPSLSDGETSVMGTALGATRRVGARRPWSGARDTGAACGGRPHGRWVSTAGCWSWVATFPIPVLGDSGDDREIRETLEKLEAARGKQRPAQAGVQEPPGAVVTGEQDWALPDPAPPRPVARHGAPHAAPGGGPSLTPVVCLGPWARPTRHAREEPMSHSWGWTLVGPGQ